MKSRRPPWPLYLPALAVFLGVTLPLLYLLVRAFDADLEAVGSLILRSRNLILLGNTLALAAGVATVSLLIAFPLAWITTMRRMRGSGVVTVLAVLPLAVPGYVIATSLLGLGSVQGPLHQHLGIPFPRITGYSGSLIALSLYNFPFLFLTLRTGLLNMDPTVLDAARSLGLGPAGAFRHAALPQLRPAMVSGMLLVVLYVFGDFGVVSLMRFETFSYAIFLQYTAAFDRVYAAWLALMLLALTAVILALEGRFTGASRGERDGGATRRRPRRAGLGFWSVPAYGFVALILAASLGLPVGTLFFWLGRGSEPVDWPELGRAARDTGLAGLPAAVAAAALAVPVAYLARRFPSRLADLADRACWFGYAVPALAFALGLIFCVLALVPALHQTLWILVSALALHFVALALGPVRTALLRAPAVLEDAARSLGESRAGAVRRVTLPLLAPGAAAAGSLVFLSCIKELPLTFLLAPLDFQPLSVKVYGYATEAQFAASAPFALAMIGIAAVVVGALFRTLGETGR